MRFFGKKDSGIERAVMVAYTLGILFLAYCYFSGNAKIALMKRTRLIDFEVLSWQQ